jgi:CheY-like chemotaxis protein
VSAAAAGDPAGVPSPVLVIDDDEDVREVVATVLGDAGFAVEVAGDGAEALRLLRGEGLAPCLILLDLMMPVMDGYRFRAAQRDDPALAAIPTIIFTAGGVGAEVEALAALAVVRKPIDLRRLLAIVRGHC